MQRSIVQPHQSADPQTAVRYRLDAVQPVEPRDVEHPGRRRNAEAQPVEKLGAAGEKRGIRLRASRERLIQVRGARISKRHHRPVLAIAAAWTASTIWG
jgi:hypothetical protein